MVFSEIAQFCDSIFFLCAKKHIARPILPNVKRKADDLGREIDELKAQVSNLVTKLDAIIAKVEESSGESRQVLGSLRELQESMSSLSEKLDKDRKYNAEQNLDRYTLTISIFFLSLSLPLYALSLTLENPLHYALLSTLYAVLGLALLMFSVIRSHRNLRKLRKEYQGT